MVVIAFLVNDSTLVLLRNRQQQYAIVTQKMQARCIISLIFILIGTCRLTSSPLSPFLSDTISCALEAILIGGSVSNAADDVR